MTSDNRHDRAYVWVCLPGATQPVVAGVLNRDGDRFIFNYGRSYLLTWVVDVKPAGKEK